MFNKIKGLLFKFRLKIHRRFIQNYIEFQNEINFKLNEYRKENQSLSGNIRTLEEQHQIMHNFLVEINKYLVTIVDKIEPQDISWANKNQLGHSNDLSKNEL